MKKDQIKIGAVLSYISIALTSIVGLVYTPIMLKMMGQSEYGLYSLVSSFIGYLTILDLGFGNAIVIYTSKYIARKDKEKEQKLHGMFLVIYSVIGIVAGIIGILLCANVDRLFGARFTPLELHKAKIMMGILTFNVVITFPFSIFGNILTAYEEFIFTKLANIIRQLLMPLIMIPLLYAGYKSVTMTIVLTILNIIVLLANTIFCIKKVKLKVQFKGFEKEILKEVCNYSIFIFLATIVEKVNWNLDQIILGTLAGTISVAVYSVASQLNSIYFSFSTAISGVMLPQITKMIEEKASDEDLSKEFIKTGRIQLLIMALVITGFVIFGKEFIYLWSGKNYEQSYYIACILMIPSTIPLIQNLGINIIQAKNRTKFRALLFAGISVVNVIISIPLAKAYGGIGAALGTAASLLLGNVLIMNIYYHKKIGLDIPNFWKSILKMLIPITILFVISYFINNTILCESWIKLLLKISLYTIMYFILVYYVAMNNYEKNLVNKLINKFKRKKTI